MAGEFNAMDKSEPSPPTNAQFWRRRLSARNERLTFWIAKVIMLVGPHGRRFGYTPTGGVVSHPGLGEGVIGIRVRQTPRRGRRVLRAPRAARGSRWTH